MLSLFVRPAAVEDAGALAALAARLFTATFAADNTADDLKEYCNGAFSYERQADEIGDPARITLLLCRSSDAPEDPVPARGGDSHHHDLLGYAMLRVGATEECVESSPAPVELQRFYIDASLHGTGAAQMLMDAALSAAQAAGGATFWLGVWERNYRALAFYQRKCGFTQVGSHVFQLGSDSQTDMILARDIAGPKGNTTRGESAAGDS